MKFLNLLWTVSANVISVNYSLVYIYYLETFDYRWYFSHLFDNLLKILSLKLMRKIYILWRYASNLSVEHNRNRYMYNDLLYKRIRRLAYPNSVIFIISTSHFPVDCLKLYIFKLALQLKSWFLFICITHFK